MKLGHCRKQVILLVKCSLTSDIHNNETKKTNLRNSIKKVVWAILIQFSDNDACFELFLFITLHIALHTQKYKRENPTILGKRMCLVVCGIDLCEVCSTSRSQRQDLLSTSSQNNYFPIILLEAFINDVTLF